MARQASSVASEIKQARPFPSLQQEALVCLLKTSDNLRWRISQLLKDAGFSQEQYNVLRILRGAGSEGLPTLEIADRMIERSPAITRLLDKLESKKYIRRKRCSKDRRIVYCYITEAGLAALIPLDHPINHLTEQLMGVLSSPALEQLIDSLDRLRQAGPRPKGGADERTAYDADDCRG